MQIVTELNKNLKQHETPSIETEQTKTGYPLSEREQNTTGYLSRQKDALN